MWVEPASGIDEERTRTNRLCPQGAFKRTAEAPPCLQGTLSERGTEQSSGSPGSEVEENFPQGALHVEGEKLSKFLSWG